MAKHSFDVEYDLVVEKVLRHLVVIWKAVYLGSVPELRRREYSGTITYEGTLLPYAVIEAGIKSKLERMVREELRPKERMRITIDV